ncbi:MAG: diacylglycerol kinase family protein [Bacillota bacterium]
MSGAKKNGWAKTFQYALVGIKWAFLHERNFKVHLLAAFLAVVVGFVLKISVIEWCLLSLAIFLVLTLEMINTSLEKVVDLVTDEQHPLAKSAKDIAAGAVLLAAINAVIVGIIIFAKKIAALI